MQIENKIYEELLDAIINDKIEYEDFVCNNKEDSYNLFNDEKFKQQFEIIKKNLNMVYNSGVSTRIDNQANTFVHLGIKYTEDILNTFKIRIYMTPENENVLKIANELLKKSFQNKDNIYFKFSNKSNRNDKIVMYLLNQDDYQRKIKIIKEIKQEHPEYFTNMKRRLDMISESSVKGVYVAPERAIKNTLGKNYPSYGVLMSHILELTRDYMQYQLKEPDYRNLKKYNRNYLMSIFKPVFDKLITSYNAYIIDNNGNLKFGAVPGVKRFSPEESIDFTWKINSNEKCFIYGKRLKDDIFRYTKYSLEQKNIIETYDANIYEYNLYGKILSSDTNKAYK